MLGDIFKLKGFFIWHLIMAITMTTVWAVLFVLTVVAFCKGKIFLAKSEEVIQDSLERKMSHAADSPRHSYNKEAHNHV